MAGDYTIQTTAGTYGNITFGTTMPCSTCGVYGCLVNHFSAAGWYYPYPTPIDYDLLARKVADLVLDEIQPKRSKATRDKLRARLQEMLEDLK